MRDDNRRQAPQGVNIFCDELPTQAGSFMSVNEAPGVTLRCAVKSFDAE